MENNSGLSLSDLNDRIALLRDNIRQLVEQAAGVAGAQDEELISARLEQQNAELEKLTKERDALITK
jgi:hypothetical protein